MAGTMISPNNKPVMPLGGAKNRKPPAAQQSTVPSAAAEASSAKRKAKSMLSQGLISPDQHAQLNSKADRIMKMSQEPSGEVV
jgi:hypothetical protein